MTLALKIKTLRKEKGMTQSELGGFLGVTKATIQKYENEVIVNLKQETISKLCEIFEVSPAYLLDWDNIFDSQKLKEEVKYIEDLQNYLKINNEGLEKIIDYAHEIAIQDEYKIKPNKN